MGRGAMGLWGVVIILVFLFMIYKITLRGFKTGGSSGSLVLRLILVVFVLVLVPYVILMLVDAMSISMGIDIVRFADVGLEKWPAGKLIKGMLARGTPVSPLDVVVGTLQAICVAFVRALAPEVPIRDSLEEEHEYDLRNDRPRRSLRGWIGWVLLATLANSFVTVLISTIIGLIFSSPKEVLPLFGVIGVIVAAIPAFGLGFVFVKRILHARVLQGSEGPRFKYPNITLAFKMFMAIGQYACITAGLIVISQNAYLGACAAPFFLAGHEVLGMVKNAVKLDIE